MKILLTCLITFFGLNAAAAAPIHYIYEGTASGSLDGTRFDNTAFRIVAEADTANRGVSSDRYTVAVDRATVGLADLGVFEFVGPRFITLIPNSSWVSLIPTSDREGFFSPIDASLAAWDYWSNRGRRIN